MNNFTPTIDPTSWYAVAYALRVGHQHCLSCNATHTSSTLWTVWATTKHPTIRRETPVHADAVLVTQLPLVQIESPSHVLLCHECVGDLATLGLVAPPKKVTDERAWNLALIASNRAAAKVEKARTKYTIEELL